MLQCEDSMMPTVCVSRLEHTATIIAHNSQCVGCLLVDLVGHWHPRWSILLKYPPHQSQCGRGSWRTRGFVATDLGVAVS